MIEAAKPFPFPIGIGIDVCRVDRIAAILRHEYSRNRWARKTFTRLEWPGLCRRFQRVEKAGEKPAGQADVASHQKPEEKDQAIAKNSNNHLWMLPRLVNYASIFEDPGTYWSVVADERSALGALAHHLAGRWAAKEAVIKAHRHRNLYMRDISIVKPPILPNTPSKLNTRLKAVALVDPPSDQIEMTPHVASRRGLRGFTFNSSGLHKSSMMSMYELRKGRLDIEDSEVQKGALYHRKSRINQRNRQVAEVNISHDGQYAIAMCMAFDPPGYTLPEKTVVDNGEGLPLHEPEWGDEGWFVSKDKPDSPPDPEEFQRYFRRVLDNDNVPPLTPPSIGLSENDAAKVRASGPSSDMPE